ncbi:MAG: histidine phosphatase family protein [Parachlamydiales bacterium]|nr:histidine phosphatase family protein [Parachlamydiales bacterium]
MRSKKKLKLTLLRHAESEDNLNQCLSGHRDTQLSEKGLWQAECLKKRFENENFQAIYCSDLSRAKSTILPYTEHQNIKVHFTPLLRERAMGIYEGTEKCTLAQAQRSMPLGVFKPQGGESLLETQERARLFLGTLMHLHEDGDILICSHGLFLQLFLTNLLQRELEDAASFKHDNTGISVIEIIGKKQIDPVKINCTAHLR